MMTQNGGTLLVQCLKGLGAKHSFGVPGESYLAVLDALHDCQGELDFTLCRNEGGASFMAAAYGKLTGTPGICFVTRGPGATNASIGIHTAMQDSVPMILFVGQVGTSHKEREAFQEIDYRAFFGSVAKWVTEIEDADRIPEILSRAWTTAISGRPGPVVVALPENVLTHMSSAKALSGAVCIEEPAPSKKTMQSVVTTLKNSRSPLIIVGGSGWKKEGCEAIEQFALKADIPVLAAFRFQDLFDNHHDCYAGDAGVGMSAATQALIKEADVILAINIRFGEMTTAEYSLLAVPEPRQKLIHIHSSERELGKIYRPNVAVVAGPNTFSELICEQEIVGNWAAWRASAREDYNASFDLPELPSPVDMGKVMSTLRTRLPDDAVLTNGAGNFAVWPNKFFKFSRQQRLLAPQSGAMGFGVPAAIAAKILHPDRTVVCIAGDGDFQMNCQELGTAMQADRRPIVLILNNGIYGTIRMHQERHFPERVSGTTLENPDFVLLAKSYGYHSERVQTTDEFEGAFERALSSQTGAVLELIISAEAITPRQSLSQIRDAAKRN